VYCPIPPPENRLDYRVATGWLAGDLAFFEERFQDYSQDDRDKLKSDYGRTVEGWEKRI
jgi:hypothetical protein